MKLAQRPKAARLLDKATMVLVLAVIVVLMGRCGRGQRGNTPPVISETGALASKPGETIDDSSELLPSGRHLTRLELHELGQSGLSIGDTSAVVKIIVFGDYSCGWCASWDSTLTNVLERYPHHVAVVFRPLLLDTLAQGLLDVHAAAYCARDQAQFLRYHRAAFANQRLVGRRLGWLAIADSAGMADRVRLERCVLSEKYRQVVIASTREAHRLGLQTTPSSIVGRRLVVGSASFGTVDTIIGERLSELRRRYR